MSIHMIVLEEILDWPIVLKYKKNIKLFKVELLGNYMFINISSSNVVCGIGGIVI